MSESLCPIFQAEEIAARARLRDEFAMHALQGLLAGMGSMFYTETAARAAYEHADAMMKAREQA